MDAKGRRHATKRDVDARLARRLDPVVPPDLAVADVVPVAMAEVDPVPVVHHAAAAPADRVGVLEHDDALPVACEDGAGDQPAEGGPDDDGIGVGVAARHGGRLSSVVARCQR